MANPYYDRPASVVPGTTIRADKYNSDLDLSESAFNALHERLQHAVFLPTTFSGNPTIPEQTVNDTFIYIDTSGNIALYPVGTLLEKFELVTAQYNQIDAWKDQVATNAIDAQDSAALSQRYANEQEDIELADGEYSARHWSLKAEAQIPIIRAAGQEKVDLAKDYANQNKSVEVEPGFYSSKHYALVAADQIPIIQAAGQEKVDLAEQAVIDAQAQVTLSETQANNASTQANNASAFATKADNFANYGHNQLVPNSGGKYSSYHWAKEAEAYAQQTLSTVNGDFVPNTRTVNGKALSSNIIIGTADIQGLSTVATSGSYNDLSNKPSAASIGAAESSHSHSYSDVDFNGSFNINGSGPGQQNNGIYVSSVTTSGTTNNPTYTAVLSAQQSSSRSIHLSVDDDDYLWGMRTHSNSGTYTFQSRVKHADRAGGVDWSNISGRPTLSTVATSGAYGDLSGRPSLATVATSGNYDDLSNKPNAAGVGAVPTSRTVNGKALSSNITLNASDVGALPSTTTLNTLGGVPTSRKVNNKALTGNITLNAVDVGAIPNSQKGQVVTRVGSSFTATKNAGINEYVYVGTGNATATINSSAFSSSDKLIIHKQRESGRLTLTSGVNMVLKDGVSGTTHHIPSGRAGTIEIVFSGSSSELRVY